MLDSEFFMSDINKDSSNQLNNNTGLKGKPKEMNVQNEIDLGELRAKYYQVLKQASETYNKNQIFVSSTYGIGTSTRNIRVLMGNEIEETDKLDERIEDPEIERLRRIMLRRSPQNLRWIYNNDDSAFIAFFLLASAVNGDDGLKCKSDEQKLKDYIDDYLKKIKVKKIQDWSIKDNHTFADCVFWKEYDEENQIIMPHHLDGITLTRLKNKITGQVKWFQAESIDSKLPKSKSKRAWKDYEPQLDLWHFTSYYNVPPKSETIVTQLFEDEVLNFQYFSVPPVKRVAELMIWKKWMEFDAKLSGQKFANPILDAVVSLPEYYDVGSDEYTKVMFEITETLIKLRNLGIMAHSDKVEIKELNVNPSKYDFGGFLNYANKQITKSLLAPQNLLEASGTELATSRTIKDMFNIFVESVRQQIIEVITELVKEQLDFVGMKPKDKSWELIYPEIDSQAQMSQSEEFDRYLQMFDRGIIIDVNEFRSMIKKFGIEMEPLTDEQLQQAMLMKQQSTGELEEGELDEEETDEIENTPVEDELELERKNNIDKENNKEENDKEILEAILMDVKKEID